MNNLSSSFVEANLSSHSQSSLLSYSQTSSRINSSSFPSRDSSAFSGGTEVQHADGVALPFRWPREAKRNIKSAQLLDDPNMTELSDNSWCDLDEVDIPDPPPHDPWVEIRRERSMSTSPVISEAGSVAALRSGEQQAHLLAAQATSPSEPCGSQCSRCAAEDSCPVDELEIGTLRGLRSSQSPSGAGAQSGGWIFWQAGAAAVPASSSSSSSLLSAPPPEQGAEGRHLAGHPRHSPGGSDDDAAAKLEGLQLPAGRDNEQAALLPSSSPAASQPTPQPSRASESRPGRREEKEGRRPSEGCGFLALNLLRCMVCNGQCARLKVH